MVYGMQWVDSLLFKGTFLFRPLNKSASVLKAKIDCHFLILNIHININIVEMIRLNIP